MHTTLTVLLEVWPLPLEVYVYVYLVNYKQLSLNVTFLHCNLNVGGRYLPQMDLPLTTHMIFKTKITYS